MPQQIQLRRGTAAAWTSTNPTLAAGELGVETDTNKFKVGNGSTAWASLPYATKGDTGPTGPQGTTGTTGAQGAAGPTGPQGAAGNVSTNVANTFTAAQTFNSGNLKLAGSTSGSATLNAPAAAATNTYTLPVDTSTLGYVNTPTNSQSANYTTVLGDSGKTLIHPSTDASARIFTIDDTLAYDAGTVITFINQTSQQLTITCSTANNLYLAGTGTQGSRVLAQYGLATCVKVATNYWLINGNGLT